MLNTIQIIVLIQGVFLVFVLLKHKSKYKTTQLRLLICCITSILFYTIGDNENNLLIKGADWFLFDSSLFITFLFLFIYFFNSDKENFPKVYYLFFIPNLIYFSIETYELVTLREPLYIEVPEFLIKLIFLSYLGYTIYSILKSKSKNWFLYFIIPITILLSIEFVDDIYSYFHLREVYTSEQNINLYFLLTVALLFYFMTYSLINSSDNLLSKKALSKYKNSNLSDECVKKCSENLISIMEEERLYLNKKLTINLISEKLNIPKQHISEVLNIYMNTNFQDFVNSYRIEAFINHLKNGQHTHYSLLGLAYEVGFNSKSSFNASFKKFKGLTPSQFQKSLLSLE